MGIQFVGEIALFIRLVLPMIKVSKEGREAYSESETCTNPSFLSWVSFMTVLQHYLDIF